jgi:hypothetical protein
MQGLAPQCRAVPAPATQGTKPGQDPRFLFEQDTGRGAARQSCGQLVFDAVHRVVGAARWNRRNTHTGQFGHLLRDQRAHKVGVGSNVIVMHEDVLPALRNNFA